MSQTTKAVPSVGKPLQPFTHGVWHIWQGTSTVVASHEPTKKLYEYATVDQCIDSLFVAGHKDTARALHAHAKGAQA